MSKTTYRVTATPRERFQTANMLFNPILKQKTIREGEAMFRARRNLGVLELSDMMLEGGVSDEMARNRTTRNVFTVTHADAEYILSAREKLELEPATEHMLMPLLLQLRAVKDSGADADDADKCPELDELAELPRWKRSLRPEIKRPEKFLDVFGDVLAQAADKEPLLRPLLGIYRLAMAEQDAKDAAAAEAAKTPNGQAEAPAPPPS